MTEETKISPVRSKYCYKCLRILPLESFYAHKAMKDGRRNECKSCSKKDYQRLRQNKLGVSKVSDPMDWLHPNNSDR